MLQLVLFTLGLGLNSGLPRLPLQSSNCLKGLGSICQSHPEYSDVTCKKKNSTVDQHVSPVAGRFSSLPSLFRDIDWIDKTGDLQLTICNFAILHLPIIWKTSSWELHPLSLFSKGMITVSTACLFCNWSYSIYTLFLSDPSPIIVYPCNSLTHSLLFSKLDWSDPGVWRCQLKTCWARYCCWCWCLETCWQ